MQVLTTIQASSPMPLTLDLLNILYLNWIQVVKLGKSGKTQISPSKSKKKGLNWQKRTASDHTAPRRSLTASRSAPSRLGLRLAQSHHHTGAQCPRSETDHLEEQRRVRHGSSELHMELLCLYSRKTANLKNGVRFKEGAQPIRAYDPIHGTQ